MLHTFASDIFVTHMYIWQLCYTHVHWNLCNTHVYWHFCNAHV